jgi:hypothetical protein
VWHVLAVTCTQLLGVDGPKGPGRQSAEQLTAAVPAEQWIACSAGHDAKGRRLSDWIRVELAAPATVGVARWLVRRSRSDGELASYACYGPADISLVGLVRVAGIRWAVEEGLEQAKGQVGSRGPPAAGGAGVDDPDRAGLCPGVVTMAPPPSGPRQTRTLPATCAKRLKHQPGSISTEGGACAVPMW